MTVELTRSDRAYRLASRVRSASLPDNGVVLDIARGRIYQMNHVGARMLELVKSGLQEPEIVARITEEFGIDFETVEHDAREFLTMLERLGVIEERQAGTANSETCA